MTRLGRARAVLALALGLALVASLGTVAQSPPPSTAPDPGVLRRALDGLDDLTAFEYRSVQTSAYTGGVPLESVMTVIREPVHAVRLQLIDQGEVGYDQIAIGEEAWRQTMGGAWTVAPGGVSGLGGIDILPLHPRTLDNLDDAGMVLSPVGDEVVGGRPTHHFRGTLPDEPDADLSGTLDLWVDAEAGFLVRSDADVLDPSLAMLSGGDGSERTHETVEVTRVNDPTLHLDPPDLTATPAPIPSGDAALAPMVEGAFTRLGDLTSYRAVVEGRVMGQPSVQRQEVVTTPELRVHESLVMGERVVMELLAVGDAIWTRSSPDGGWQASLGGVACDPGPCSATDLVDFGGAIAEHSGTFTLVSDTETLDGAPVVHLRSEAGFDARGSQPVPGTVDLWIDRAGGHLVRIDLDGQGVEIKVAIQDVNDPTIVVEPPTPDELAPSAIPDVSFIGIDTQSPMPLPSPQS